MKSGKILERTFGYKTVYLPISCGHMQKRRKQIKNVHFIKKHIFE